MKHGSLFTGVGGIDLGFDAAGIETLWQCEIDPKCRSVLAKHWPDAVRYDDVCQVNGAEVQPVDVITFGSPCQDLSIAGKRKGFQDGTRSNLYFEAVRIIEEMRNATQNQYPRYAIWENVRGAISSNGGQDFLAAIQALADIGAVDISWRVVNTCNFGPPQRRVRVFVVADFGGERAGEVLSKPARVLWHPAPRAEARALSAGETEGSARSSEWQQSRRTVAAVTQHLSNGADDNFAQGGQLVYKEIASCLSTSNQRIDSETETFVLETGVRRLTPRECERLQGWPDDHTRYDNTGKELSDSSRYKMCGNGVSAPVAQWIGENLVS
jgi:DNA (cytosine-5)-methyltransferase 1